VSCRAFLALALSLATLEAAAMPLASLAPGLRPDEVAALIAGKSLSSSPASASGLRLAPVGAEGAAMLAEASARPGRFLVETAYLVRGLDFAMGRELAAYNGLTRFSSLSGVTYDSFTRKRETVLLSDVHRVDAPGSTKSLPDVAATLLPTRAAFEIYARDVNFGSTWYSVVVDCGNQGFALALTNSRPQSIFAITAFDTGALRLRYAMLGADEGVYVYALCAAEPGAVAATFVDMFSAATKRLEAIRRWAVARLEEGSK
jgi:hypothetical protein